MVRLQDRGMKVPGFFMTIEGPDGAGKTTQVNLLAAQLEKRGIRYIKTREPGGTRISDQIRSLLLDPESYEMNAKTEALLYAASRAQLVAQVIRPALEERNVVICDRYVDASIAYQGALGLSHEDVRLINDFATQKLQPDRTYLIDIPVEKGIARIQHAKRIEFGHVLDRIEQRALDYHTKVREGFHELAAANPKRYVCIDGLQSMEDIARQILQDVLAVLPFYIPNLKE